MVQSDCIYLIVERYDLIISNFNPTIPTCQLFLDNFLKIKSILRIKSPPLWEGFLFAFNHPVLLFLFWQSNPIQAVSSVSYLKDKQIT